VGWRLIHGHSRVRGQVGEVELGLVLVMLARRLVVGQRRIHLVQVTPQVPLLALAIAGSKADRCSPSLVPAFPEDPCSASPVCEALTLSSNEDTFDGHKSSNVTGTQAQTLCGLRQPLFPRQGSQGPCAPALTAVLRGGWTCRLVQGRVRLRGQIREVELVLVLVMLTRRLVVGQRRIHLVQEGTQAPRLALAIASIGLYRGSPLLFLASPVNPCNPSTTPVNPPTVSSDVDIFVSSDVDIFRGVSQAPGWNGYRQPPVRKTRIKGPVCSCPYPGTGR
jgi:hypothetical protein